MPSGTSALSPTWTGFISDTREALILFEAVLAGNLHRVTRRPHDRERSTLIVSGSVFIYEEGASGIKRWTDGVSWSPSRILNNFLIYRELDKPFAPGEKKRAKPKGKQPDSDDSDVRREGSDPSAASPAVASPVTPLSAADSPQTGSELAGDRDATRSLVGSLTDSYAFKPSGLVKKTMSVVVQGCHFHLVSYYKPEDVTANLLPKPMDTELRWTKVRGELVTRQNFRTPIEDAEEMVPASQYNAPLPRTAFNAGPAFIAAPDYMQQHPGQHEGYIPPPYSMSMQQHGHEAYADPRHGTHMQSPTHAQPPSQGPSGAYMPQLPNMQMRQGYGQYSHYAEQQQRMGIEQQQRMEQQRYIEHQQQQRQQPSPHGSSQQQPPPPQMHAHQQQQQQQHAQEQQPQSGQWAGHMQMPHGWPGNQMPPR